MQNSLRHLLLLTFLLADLRRPTSPWDDRTDYNLVYPGGGLNLLCSPLSPSPPALCGSNLALITLTLMGILSLPLRYRYMVEKKCVHQSKWPSPVTDQEGIPPGVRPQTCVEGGGKKGLSLLLILCAIGVVGMLLIMAGDVEQNPGPPKRQRDVEQNPGPPKTKRQAPVLPELKDLASLHIVKWREVGLQLGIEVWELDRIQADNKRDPYFTQRCMTEMFSTWLKTGSNPSYNQLVEALASAGEMEVAEDLCEKYGIASSVTKYVPDCLKQYAAYLKERYRAMSVFQEGEWPPFIGRQRTERFIKLAMIQHMERFPAKESTKVISEGCLLGNIYRIIASKREIELPEVFKPVTDEEGKQLPLRVLVDGAPGVGKTTLCLKVCKDWAERKLLINCNLLVLLQLRRTEVLTSRTVEDLFYFPNPTLRDEVVSSIVQSYGEGVVLLLDAYDELSQEQRRRSIFYQLIYGHLLPRCSIIVTSRPYASVQLQELPSIQRHIEVLGFTNNEIQNCIRQNIPDKEKGEELAQIVEERQDIALFCYVPLNCAILLYVYKMENYTLPSTSTQLFTLFIINALKRHARLTNVLDPIPGIDSLPSPMQGPFDSLCTIAYNGLICGQLIFSHKDLCTSSQGHQPAVSQLLGLMTATKSFTSMGEDVSYQFLHLTIQEFLAARYVVTRLSPEEQVAFFRRNISDDRFRVTLVFVAGMSHLQNSDYTSLFCQKIDLHPSPRIINQPYNYGYESAIQHFLFLTHLLYESQNDTLCVTLASAFEEKTITLWVTINMTLFNCMTLCYFLLRSACKWRLTFDGCWLPELCFEAFERSCLECPKQTGFVQELKLVNLAGCGLCAFRLIPQTPLFRECHKMVLSSFKLVINLPLIDLLNIPFLRHLQVVHCNLSESCIKLLTSDKSFLQIQRLKLSYCNLKDLHVNHIAACLKQNNSLKQLDISYNDITADGLILVFKALQQNTCLEDLNICGNFKLVEGDCVKMVGTISAVKPLKILNVCKCGGMSFIPLLHSLSEKPPPGLQELHVDGYTWTPSNPLVVSSCPTERIDLTCTDYQKLYGFILHVCAQNTPHQCCEHLKHLDFSHSPMTRQLAREWSLWLCEAIGYLLTHSSVIESLNLSNCALNNGCVQYITTGLEKNSSLKVLNSSYNQITCCKIFEVLQQNKCLECLDVSNLKLLGGGTRALMNLIKHTTTLRTINLSHCGITDDCVKCIAVGFEQNKSLKELDISHNRITAEGAICLFDTLQPNRCLEKLSLVGNELHDDIMNAIDLALQTNSQLKSLNLCKCGPIVTLPLLHSLSEKPPPSLQELHLDGYTWTPSNPLVVSSCPTERIDLLTCTDYQKLYGFMLHMCAQKTPHQCCEHLRHLDFSDSLLTRERSLWLCSVIGYLLAHSSVIESLNLSNCALNNDCIQCIAAGFQQNNNYSLKELDISLNSITAKGAICLFELLQQNKSLEKLSLDGNELYGDIETLVNAIDLAFQTNSQLKSLSVHKCASITLPLLFTLSEKPPPGLQQLHVDGYTWTPSNPLVVSSCPTERIDLLTCRDYQKLCGFVLHMCAQKTPHQCCKHLRHLDFSGSRLAVERNVWLCGVIGYLLAHSSVIESLNLSDCRFDNDCARCIASGLERNSSLKVLNINDYVSLPLLFTLSEKPPPGLQEVHVDGYTWTPSNPVVVSSCPTEPLYESHGEDYHAQPWYECHTCWGGESDFGCCLSCAFNCHKGHRLVYRPTGQVNAYCNCGCNYHQKSVCTRHSTKDEYVRQPFYRCYDCFKGSLEFEGCCYQCVQKCHAGHNTRYDGIMNAFCDCGLTCCRVSCSIASPK